MGNTIRTYRHPFSSLADGSEAALTLTEISSGVDGPTVGISGAIHGNESTGTEVILELFRSLKDKPIKGRLLLLPVSNPWAFAKNRRHTPIDELNLNREFPGDAGGTLTQQLAVAIAKSFLEKIDVHIDLHSGTDRPTVDYVYLLNDERMSRAFGSKILYRPKEGVSGTTFGGTTKSVTIDRRGIPATVIELGGGILDQRPYVQRGLAGVTNMLKTVGALPGDPTPPPKQIVVRGISLIRPTRGGWLETLAPPLGEEIAGGAPLGRVTSPYTFQELELIPNPVKRGIMILSHLSRNLVEPGDYGYMVGDMEGAEA
jgi:predicted deacylase